MPRLLATLSCALLLVGCKKVEPAPKELDALLHYFFSDYEDAEDEQVAEAFRNLDQAVRKASEDEHFDGSVTSLTRDEISSTGLDHADPSKAVGLFMVNTVDCSLAQMTELVTAKNQMELYGTYDSFDRTWTSDVAAFRSRQEDLASWTEEFTVSVVGKTYSAENEGGARRVPDLGEEESPFGPLLLTRRFMIAPAEFEDEGNSYPQDWRAEVYYSRNGGQVVHVAAMWREASFGSLDSTSEGVQRLVLNGMKDWDDDSENHCAEM